MHKGDRLQRSGEDSGDLVETGGGRETVEVHVQRDIGSSKAARAMGIQNTWQGQGMGGKGRLRTVTGEG